MVKRWAPVKWPWKTARNFCELCRGWRGRASDRLSETHV